MVEVGIVGVMIKLGGRADDGGEGWGSEDDAASASVEGGGGGFRSESVSKKEYDRLLLEEGVASVDGRRRGGAVLGRVAAGYSVSPQNCVQSGSFGRVFVDEAVQWVVRAGDDVIAVFDGTGRDHWLREVLDGS